MAELNVIIKDGQDGYFISKVLGLPGCHAQAKTLKTLMKRAGGLLPFVWNANSRMWRSRI